VAYAIIAVCGPEFRTLRRRGVAMDAFYAIRDRALRKTSAWWHMLPWGERVLYVLTTLLVVPTILLTVLVVGFPSWFDYGPVWSRLIDVNNMLLMATATCYMASTLLAGRRKRPDAWSVVRQSWSVRAIFVGSGIMAAIIVWSSVLDLAGPVEQFPAITSPPLLPAFVAGLILCGGGLLLVIPELIVRKTRAKRRQV
jgi:Ni/Fe-hydrogenase subunit HybB-like protein